MIVIYIYSGVLMLGIYAHVFLSLSLSVRRECWREDQYNAAALRDKSMIQNNWYHTVYKFALNLIQLLQSLWSSSSFFINLMNLSILLFKMTLNYKLLSFLYFIFFFFTIHNFCCCCFFRFWCTCVLFQFDYITFYYRMKKKMKKKIRGKQQTPSIDDDVDDDDGNWMWSKMLLACKTITDYAHLFKSCVHLFMYVWVSVYKSRVSLLIFHYSNCFRNSKEKRRNKKIPFIWESY